MGLPSLHERKGMGLPSHYERDGKIVQSQKNPSVFSSISALDCIKQLSGFLIRTTK